MKTYLEPQDIDAIENEAKNFRDRLLIHLLFRTGCRVSESLALEVTDIDFGACTVTIEHLKTQLRLSCPVCCTRLSRSHSYCPKCGIKVKEAVADAKENRRIRTIPVDSQTMKMLADFIKKDRTKGRIFKINRHRSWQIISECAERAGLPKLKNPETGKVHHISPHKLRDAFSIMAVQQNDSNDSIRMLQEQLGHASISTTMRYRKVAGQELKSWYQALWEKDKQ